MGQAWAGALDASVSAHLPSVCRFRIELYDQRSGYLVG
jgi:hypothetical protein